jgi:hypothetical protein
MVRFVDGVPWEDIVTFARTYYPKSWRVHLTEHLRPVLAAMGQATADSARVRLATPLGQVRELDTAWSPSLARRLRRHRLSDDAR